MNHASLTASLLLVLSFIGEPVGAADSTANTSSGFQQIPDSASASGKDRFEVIEFFWYGCPYCYRFESQLDKWVTNLPEDVDFTRVPAVLRQGWAAHARTFYTAEALGVLQQVHPRLFTAIHKEDRTLDNEADLEEFFAEQGVDRALFKKAYHSPEVIQKVHDASLLTRRYGIEGVPTIIVNEKYRTDSELAGGLNRIIEVVDSLIDRKRDAPVTP